MKEMHTLTGCLSENALQNTLTKSRKMLFIVRINSKLHSIIAKIMNIKLTIFTLDIMMTILTGVLNFSVTLPLSSRLNFLAKKLGIKNLSTRLDKWQIMVF